MRLTISLGSDPAHHTGKIISCRLSPCQRRPAMIPEEMLKIVVEKLDECGVAYMIVGSLASNIHGKPRATHDADIVVEIDESGIEKFAQALGNDFYFDVEAAKDAVKKNSCATFSTMILASKSILSFAKIAPLVWRNSNEKSSMNF
jgi:hypothetical protein